MKELFYIVITLTASGIATSLLLEGGKKKVRKLGLDVFLYLVTFVTTIVGLSISIFALRGIETVITLFWSGILFLHIYSFVERLRKKEWKLIMMYAWIAIITCILIICVFIIVKMIPLLEIVMAG